MVAAAALGTLDAYPTGPGFKFCKIIGGKTSI